MTATTRWLSLEGLTNVRDLGGLPTTDGGTTRAGVLLRSDDPIACTAVDVAHLVDERRLSLVIDLRTDDEHAADPGCPLVRGGVERMRAPLVDHLVLGQAFDVDLVPGDEDGAIEWMAAGYLQIGQEAAPQIVRILDRLVSPGSVPALVHCAAGKDRTGIVVALLLAAAGVDTDAVVADYALTGERVDAVIAAIRRRTGQTFDRTGLPPVLLQAPAACMRWFLDQLGDASSWLVDAGAPPAHLDQWRRLLVERAPGWL